MNMYNRPPFRMEYRHLNKMGGTKKLLWNWNIKIFQLLMDCLIYNNMISYNKQWNTLPQLWNLLISIFHSSMEFHGIFHGIPWNFGAAKWNITKFHGIPWNFEIVILFNTMLLWTCMGYSMEFHGTLESPNKKSPSSMGFHGIRRAPF